MAFFNTNFLTPIFCIFLTLKLFNTNILVLKIFNVKNISAKNAPQPQYLTGVRPV